VKISLFVPCFVDQFFPGVAIGMVKILEKLGHEVAYPEGQTCCGQPPFNSGYWDEARAAADHALDVFRDAEVVVGASGSCGAMMRVFYPELYHGRPREAEAKALAAKSHEFSAFLVNVLGVTDLGASFDGRVTFHDGCHGLRELGIKREPRALLKKVRGLELVEMGEAETCCGFGGTFAVKYPEISSAMGEVKCASIVETTADYVVSNDSSCLMQIQGMLQRQGSRVKGLHLAELLAQGL
jgi:L-lactate dehydrogenase complex protein LldE